MVTFNKLSGGKIGISDASGDYMIKIILDLLSKGEIDEAKKLFSNKDFLLKSIIDEAYESADISPIYFDYEYDNGKRNAC